MGTTSSNAAVRRQATGGEGVEKIPGRCRDAGLPGSLSGGAKEAPRGRHRLDGGALHIQQHRRRLRHDRRHAHFCEDGPNPTHTLRTSWNVTDRRVRQIFYYLLKTPVALQKVVDEIDRAEASGHLSDFVTRQEAGNLTYFQACVKEALRESLDP